jgi:hypothetical protein
MLKHMGKARSPARVVDGARIHVRVEGDDRCVVPFEHDEMKAVGQGEFRYVLLEFLKILRD